MAKFSIKGKTIKSVEELPPHFVTDGMYNNPARIVLHFTDGTSATIVPSENGDIYAGEHPYIKLDIREGIHSNKGKGVF